MHKTSTIVASAAAVATALGAGPGALAGGVATQPPMGDPLPDLTTDQLIRFLDGREAFNFVFEVEDGLGPTFNKESCGGCHSKPVGGPGSIAVTRAGVTDKGGFDPLEQFGGPLFQQESISEDCAEEVPPQANTMTMRLTNGMLGYGLVEAISNGDIFVLGDPSDANGDGISGKPHMVFALEDAPGSPPRVGRFGWKAHAATMMTFSADASLNELGITNPLLPDDNDPNGIDTPLLVECDDVADPEMDMTFIHRLTDFQRFLAPPPQTPKSGMTGEAIFDAIGCARCHVRSFTTSNDPELEDAIRGKTVTMYSDFLLHDMGLGGDGIPDGDATATEIRTTPLAGVRFRDPMWHDGRIAAGTFDSRIRGAAGAIHWHDQLGSEAQASAHAFEGLSEPDQQAVLAFLSSLGRREFDVIENDMFDNRITMLDFAGFGQDDAFAPCYFGDDNGAYTPDHPCAIHDVDQDGDVDTIDFDAFLTVYEDEHEDCNGNKTHDIVDIIEGTAKDANFNGVPDECECLADASGDGVVDVADLIVIITNWGCTGVPCEGDINLDGVVNVFDIIDVFTSWGPCQGG